RLLEPSPEPIPNPTGEQAAARDADVSSADPRPVVHRHAGIHLDLHQRIVRVQDRIVEVSRLEFELLAALMESPRRVLTHGELAERVWENCDVETKTISMLVSRLRRRIIAAGGPRIAHAVPGVGYRLAYGT
ncbi:MAG: winged helix-turn-helix domain-containing protein, partial [Acidobacteria bacterium]|nr:winged helix-turn-helix domain-containing protein [Acidobacteriota bacterium]